jgi:hypothetical protein
MKFNQDKVPATIIEAVNDIVLGLTEAEKKELIGKSPTHYHMSVGMFLRNSWSLWEKDTPLYNDFKKRFKLFGHADDISGVILEGVWGNLNGKDSDDVMNEAAKTYRKHWKHYGVDPKTGKDIVKS